MAKAVVVTMRIAGSALLILSGLLWGITAARKLKRREQMLLDLKKLLLRFKTGISFSSRSVSELILENRDSLFCNRAADEPCFPFDPCEALKLASEALLANSRDQELVRGFADGLGTSDTESQLNHVELYAGLLETNLAEARGEYAQKSKLYVALGLFSGVTICLIL